MSASKLHRKHILLYDKANFDQINLELGMFYDDYILGFTNRNIEANWTMFKEKHCIVIDKHIPSISVSSSACAPWFTHSVKTSLNKKKRLFPVARLSESEPAHARCDDCAQQYRRDTYTNFTTTKTNLILSCFLPCS